MRPNELSLTQVVAVSGGMDSMALLWVANALFKQKKLGGIRAVFVHHHTRAGQDDDNSLVRKFCEQESIGFKSLHIEGLDADGPNFEGEARRYRKALLEVEVKRGERLWQGHHLDDSYEWHLMQVSRSTNLKACLGIPVRNGKIVRPFLCATRAQIKRLVEFEGIPFIDDPTNLDLKHDRNYIRHSVVAPLRLRYSSYLKHYAHLANFTATILKLNLSGPTTSEFYSYEQGAVLIGRHFSEVQIQEIIHTYSNTDRGEIVGPIQKMLRAIDNDKKGPFQFSGGMQAYYTANLLMLYPQNFTNYDSAIAMILSQLTQDQLKAMPQYKRVEFEHAWKHLLNRSDAMLSMPGPVLVLESDSICKTLNTSVFDPLFPRVSEVCKARGMRFVYFQKCIEVWQRKKEKLPERLRLLPLYNLSNLFSSQQ